MNVGKPRQVERLFQAFNGRRVVALAVQDHAFDTQAAHAVRQRMTGPFELARSLYGLAGRGQIPQLNQSLRAHAQAGVNMAFIAQFAE